MALEDYGEFRLIHPERLFGVEDELAEAMRALIKAGTDPIEDADYSQLATQYAEATSAISEVTAKLGKIQAEINQSFRMRR